MVRIHQRLSSGRYDPIIVKLGSCLIIMVGIYCGVFLQLLAGVLYKDGDIEALSHDLRGQPHARLIERKHDIATISKTGGSVAEQLKSSGFSSKKAESPLLAGSDASIEYTQLPTSPKGATIKDTPSNKEQIDNMLTKASQADVFSEHSPCLTEQDCAMARGDTLRAFNSWSRDRFICGKLAKPKEFVEFNATNPYCHQGFRVHSQEPALKVMDHDMTDLLFNQQKIPTRGNQSPSKYSCTIPCEEHGTATTVSRVHVHGTALRFHHSMESASNYNELLFDPEAWKRNVFYATTSFQSDIPLPYFSWAEYSIQSPAVDYDAVIKGASFIATNCGTINDREGVVKLLGQMIKVESLGACLGNAKLPAGSTNEDKNSIMNKYLFHFAFENCNEEDYVSEKLWGALGSGTLPVYMGAHNIQEHVPERSIISWHDFENTRELGEYLKQVAADKELYESYHVWRSQPMPEHFHRKYDMTHVHSACRTCKWAYAKQRGLGWSHENQEIIDLRLPRKLCLDQSGKIVYPIVEDRGRKPVTIAASSSCSGIHASKPMIATVKSWKRTVWFHDGVIDISLEGKSNDVYQIFTPLHGSRAVQIRKSVYRIQDSASRFTIVGDPHISISAQGEGSIDIRTTSTIGRLRIILEDVDNFHGGGAADQDGPNYFYGQEMENEFEHPLMFVKVASAKGESMKLW